MATGRTSIKHWRAYIDGYDMSGYARDIGPLACTFEEGEIAVMGNNVKEKYIGSATISVGTLNGVFDNTADSGFHTVLNSVNLERDVMVALGIQAAPANNDPVFVGQFTQLGYTGDTSTIPVTASIQFSNMTGLSDALGYAKPWGVLLHANAAATAANSATGLDQTAQSTQGGYMMYQVTAGNGTAAIKVQDADTNVDGSFSDLLTSGVIDCSSPTSGVVALASTATVERYVRWQVALGTATTVTFALAFVRNNIT